MSSDRPAAVVLCGGKSRRMGRDKAWLPIGGETMLERTVRAVGRATDPILVVAAAGQELPASIAFQRAGSSRDVRVVRDRLESAGPLGGIAAAHRVLAGQSEFAFVCACDLPNLRPEFVTRLSELVGDFDAAVPVADGRRHPLAAVYRVRALAKAEELLDRGEHRAMALLDALNLRLVSALDLADVDPELRSLQNVNTPQDYAALDRNG